MWIIFIILGVVMVWGLCKSGSRFSEPNEEQSWRETIGQPGKNPDDELEKIRRQVWEDRKRQEVENPALKRELVFPFFEVAQAESQKYNKELEEKYFQSPLTKRIIATISDETGRLPEQIDVYVDKVTGRSRGVTRIFDFLTERVPKLEKKSFAYKTQIGDSDYTNHTYSSPEEALAAAINRILGDEYEMNWVYQGSYPHRLQDHVVLTLRAKTYF